MLSVSLTSLFTIQSGRIADRTERRTVVFGRANICRSSAALAKIESGSSIIVTYIGGIEINDNIENDKQ